MFRWSRELRAFGGLSLVATGCGGLLGGGDENDCAAADCGSVGGSGHAGVGGRVGKGGGAGIGGSGRGGTGTETGGTTSAAGGTSGATGGTTSSTGGSGGSGARGGTAASGTGGTSGDAGASSNADDCKEPSDCELVPVDCCGTCVATSADYVALNRDAVSDYISNRPCTDRICPECAPTGVEWLTATCVASHCQVLDARVKELNACEVSDDCYLRAGLDCCEACGSSPAFVALSKRSEATLLGLVCDSEFACDACVAVPPETLSATCVEGRCETMTPTR